MDLRLDEAAKPSPTPAAAAAPRAGPLHHWTSGWMSKRQITRLVRGDGPDHGAVQGETVLRERAGVDGAGPTPPLGLFLVCIWVWVWVWPFSSMKLKVMLSDDGLKQAVLPSAKVR